MLEANLITKSYGTLRVLKGVSLTVAPHEIVSVVGASGAGKTTLLQILGSLIQPDSGKVTIHGNDLFSLGEKELSRFRNREIGFVFQFHHLLPEFTAFENVCIPGYIAGTKKTEVEKRAHELLQILDLRPRETHKPSELSGGEKQRVAIARALINDPSVILADEPSGNLDSQNQEELYRLFFSLRGKFGHTFVIVTHDDHFAGMTDRMIRLQDGCIKSA
ncbi:MAG: ABC transporter ATP-binding protein [Bacteroidetes bacterium]|nr:ABC transporter ATP-binding protein [Bacteroidota bacterium]MCL6103800.1 ABC transporter ATP-binding protein [Bacteroidota bacterium]